jgi:E3 ubiquitin-protein ligase Mdm2
MEAPKDASIVHGETAHICCCLGCARELKEKGSGCPICREPIDAVLRHFVV